MIFLQAPSLFFTDVEGSTKPWHELGAETYSACVYRHRATDPAFRIALEVVLARDEP
jgi:hypothetical protein